MFKKEENFQKNENSRKYIQKHTHRLTDKILTNNSPKEKYSNSLKVV